MSDIIHKLSAVTSNQIAAGEVVKRPSSVVKELMENAIDADSSMIIVNIEEAGKELIQVIDDGKGMSYNDAFFAFERHATSKIQDSGDLYKLSTFGFRGEALPSIASISEIELKTCLDNEDLGCKVVIHGGELQKHVKEVTSKGTQISVKNLFYNVPQRRRFLKANSSETKHILNEFRKIALCNPQVALYLYINSKGIYSLPMGPLRNRVNYIIGKNINAQLMEISVETSIVTIKGYISSPNAAIQTAEQFMFVNGRYFRTSYFHKAIMRAYENLIPNTKASPRYFLYLTVSSSEIDVNADPEKVDVKFENDSQIWQILHTSVKAVLGKNGLTPAIDFEVSENISLSDGDSFNSIITDDVNNEPFNPFDDEFSFSQAVYGNSYDDSVMNSNSFENYSDEFTTTMSEHKLSEEEFGEISEELPKSLENDLDGFEIDMKSDIDKSVTDFENSNESFFSQSFSNDTQSQNDQDTSEFLMEHSFSFHGEQETIAFNSSVKKYDTNKIGRYTVFAEKYLIVPIEDKIVIIRILSALKRIHYEKYLKLIKQETKSVVNKLMFPVTIPLSVTHNAVIEQCKPDLENIGFAIEMDEINGEIEITGIPPGYEKYNLYEVFEDIIERISGDDIDGYNEDKKENLVSRLSGVEAVKRNNSITFDEYGNLIEELFMCDNYNFSPKGSPIFVELNKEHIDNLLK